MPRVDHLVYGTPDLDSTVAEIEQRLGVRAVPGGRHPGQGTRNAVVALGPTTYLEILGPDPEQPDPDQPRWLGIDDLTGPRLVTWAARGTDLQALVTRARENGVRLGSVLCGSRQQRDGSMLTWQLTDPRPLIADGIVPFFIDWGDSPHPARAAPRDAQLIGLRATHPDAGAVRGILDGLELDLPLQSGPSPALIATVRTPNGPVELR